MIVCAGCGKGLPCLNVVCERCSGRGIERPSPFEGLLRPSQQSGSPDRWAKSYTAPSSSKERGSASFEKQRVPNANPKQALQSPTKPADKFDIPLQSGLPQHETLARVYGCVLDPSVRHPQCASCHRDIPQGDKLFIAPRPLDPIQSQDVLCRLCYTNAFKLGMCQFCHLPVLGEREEGHGGAHVSGSLGAVWHSKCFNCSGCHTPLFKADHLVQPMNRPFCMACAEGASKADTHLLPKRRYAPPVVTVPRGVLATYRTQQQVHQDIRGLAKRV